MFKRISILALILGAIAAAQIGVGGPSDLSNKATADRFSAAAVPVLDFGDHAPRWTLPKS